MFIYFISKGRKGKANFCNSPLRLLYLGKTLQQFAKLIIFNIKDKIDENKNSKEKLELVKVNKKK